MISTMMLATRSITSKKASSVTTVGTGGNMGNVGYVMMQFGMQMRLGGRQMGKMWMVAF